MQKWQRAKSKELRTKRKGLGARSSVLCALCCCVCITVAWAQETGQVVVPVSNEYIKEWLVLGPFFPDNLDTDFLAGVGGEANVQPKEGSAVTTADGKTLTWKRHKSKGSKISLLDAVGNYENATAYAFCVLQSEVAGDARVYVGSDDGIAVWVNGKQMHHHDVARALRLDQDMFKANLKAGANHCLVKVSQGTEAWGFAMRVDVSPPNYAVLSGRVIDAAGRPVRNAYVLLEQDVKEVARTRTDDSGSYRLNIYPARGSYDLSATEGERGGWQLGIPLHEGERQNLNLTLKEAISIEGTLLMLDDKTPHVAVPVQAVIVRRRKPVAVATALSDGNGKYRLINLRSGRYLLRCYTLGGYVYYKWGKSMPVGMSQATSLRVEYGKTIANINFRFAPFKKGTWRNYDTLDGLAHNAVMDIYCDPDGVMWFATDGGGVSRYDGEEFMNLTAEDGLPHNTVLTIYVDPDGVMWFGTLGGVSRYDGKGFVNFTREDGLANSFVRAVHGDPDGVMWFGTAARLGWGGSGVFRYDGKEFVNFTRKDGLAGDSVNAIYCDPDGILWFGTNGGVSRYDGRGTGDSPHFVNFTTKDGLTDNSVNAIYRDHDGMMWFGTNGGVSRYDGKTFANFTTRGGLVHNIVLVIHRDLDGVMWFGTEGGISRYDGKGFVNLTTKDGLASNWVSAIYCSRDGTMWFGTGATDTSERGGVSQYDGRGLINFTARDGLVHNAVVDIHRSPDGVMWFATQGGVSCYNEREFVNFTTKDGLASSNVLAVCGGSDGVMWCGTILGGASRYSDKGFVNFSTKDGLADNTVFDIYRDPDGVMWFGTLGGVSRYDGNEFVNFTVKDGLVYNLVSAVCRAPNGAMWFGTWGIWGGGGLSRYDGSRFENFTVEDGLADNSVSAIHADPNGVMWFGTLGGVSRYDGRGFANFTAESGLASNRVSAIYRDPNGSVWVGTDGGGVSCYDGIAWTSLDTRDGLTSNTVSSIHRDADGYLWFGTERGVTRYRRNTTPPKARIVSVTTDQTYRDLSTIPAFSLGARVTIEYDSIDFKTVPEKRQYRCRINDIGARHASPLQWGKPTKATQFDWTSREAGTYTFEVQAIDRDLNYSEPASLSIVISGLPFYRTGIFLIALSIVGGGSLFGIFVLGVQRSRASRAEKLRLQHELEDARQMQVRLLPERAPSVKGFDIAGFSHPAREVGGDFFDYLSLTDGKIGIAIADVSGKGLKAAMNAVLANGMLHEVGKIEASCGDILSALNADLYPRMEKGMFTALGLAILDRDARTLQWANAAQPYPLIKRDNQLFDIKGSSELPLGMMANVTYPDWELELQAGDIVIFYTDGIIEAENEAAEMYGTERLEEVVMHANPTMGAAEIISAILQAVGHFAGSAEQYDDMTIAVVKRL